MSKFKRWFHIIGWFFFILMTIGIALRGARGDVNGMDLCVYVISVLILALGIEMQIGVSTRQVFDALRQDRSKQ